MKDKDICEMGRFIEKQNWAIMPGDDRPESGGAEACAKHLATKSRGAPQDAGN